MAFIQLGHKNVSLLEYTICICELAQQIEIMTVTY